MVSESAFEEMVPVTAQDRLGFLNPTGERADRVVPFPGDLERVFTCTGCGATIAVGPCWEDIDPESFVGISCGCFERLGGIVHSFSDAEPSDAAATAGTVGNSREVAS